MELTFILNLLGEGLINDNMQKILTAMDYKNADVGLGVILYYARVIGCCLALGVGANECFQMMLGRRGMDVMKILHIIIISLCITYSGAIVSMAKAPGKKLEQIAHDSMLTQGGDIKALENQINDAQERYIERLREHSAELLEAKQAQRDAENSDDGFFDKMASKVEDGMESAINTVKEWMLIAETSVAEFFSMVIKWMAEVLLQAMLYGTLVMQRVFMHVLEAFAPLMFAISLSPHFKSAWSQWLSKYISLSLWGFVAYTIMYYVFFLIEETLQSDLDSYELLIDGVAGKTESDYNLIALGMQSFGTTCMYAVGCFIGIKALSYVSEVASWCIPGGVASGSNAVAQSSVQRGGENTARGAVGGVKTVVNKI